MNSIRLSILNILLLTLTHVVSGNELYFRSLGVKDGLSQPSAISIWQDPAGRMWFGNDALNCYDGTTTKVFRLSEYFPSIEDSNIHAICGNDSVLFLLAENKVISLNLLTNQLSQTDLTASSICVTGNRLYAAKNHAVVMYDLQTKEKKVLFTNDQYYIKHITHSKDNEFWLGTTSGIVKVDFTTQKLLSVLYEKENIVCQFPDSENRLWLGTRSNKVAVIYPDGRTSGIESNSKPFTPYIHCFTEDKQGNIWIGTLAGVYKVANNKDGKPALESDQPLMPESPVTALYTDQQGTLWIGPYYGNIRYINMDTNNLTFYTCNEKISDKLHGVVLGAMAEDNEGNLYVGTEGSGINIVDKNRQTIRHITAASHQLPNNKIRALWFDKQANRMFISTYKEDLIYLDTKKNRFGTIKSPLLQVPVRSTVEEIIPYKEMLILLTQHGILKLDRQTLQVSYLFENPDLQKMCSGNIRTIYVDDKNRLWVSSLEEGLFTADLSSGKLLHTYGNGLEQESIIPSAVNSICGNTKDGLYLSTLNSGILLYNEEKNNFQSYTKQNNLLLSDICYNIAMSPHRNLVVTTNKGISVIDISVKKKIGSAYHIQLNDLAQISGFGMDCGIYISAYSNDIFVGALYGLVAFNEHNISTQADDYSLLLSSLSINNKPVSPENSPILTKDIAFTRQIVLPFNENTVSLTFSTTNYALSNYTPYEYKMEGLDNLWITTDNKTITYPSLQPGQYKLTVREAENHQQEASIEITVKQPYWLSLPAVIIYILLSISIFICLIRIYKNHMVLKSSLDLEKKESERIEKATKERLSFFTNISNEFRAPLTIIITLLNQLATDNAVSGKSRIGKVQKQALYLQNLITQLLAFSSGEQKELRLNTEQHSAPEPEEEEIETADCNPHYSILIVDNDDEIRALLKETFSFAYRILEAKNGDDGYSLITREHPDIILCEISIPGISGTELCKMHKSNTETLHIPIILMSGHPATEQQIQSLQSGADDYIVKPFNMELVLHKCNSLIRNRKNIINKYIQQQANEQATELLAINNQDQQFLDSAIQVIETNLDNTDFDIILWSKSLGVGRTTLFNQIKAITGMTPNDYILSYKMKKAMVMLRQESNCAIAEIAYRLGYSDPTYFSRSFKKIVGVSPQQYRKFDTEQNI